MKNLRVDAESRKVTTNKLAAFSTRCIRLGVASLLSLLAGGLILVLTSVNALLAPNSGKGAVQPLYPEESANRFYVGHTWSLQAWIAIVGVGFGLLSHGFNEAYIHLFDWWCSRRAKEGPGLDYARYLNTQPRAPVAYGIRGFPTFATLRYFLVIMTITASIGYKFGITVASTFWTESLRPDVFVSDPTGRDYYVTPSVAVSHWIADPSNHNFAYIARKTPTWANFSASPDTITGNLFEVNPNVAPTSIIMTGTACIEYDNTGQRAISGQEGYEGWIVSREVVAVANMTEEVENFTVSGDEDGWFRVQNRGNGWFNDTGEQAVLDYRVLEPGKFQIQWTRMGLWATDAAAAKRAEIAYRLTYSVNYRVAEVTRAIPWLSSCSNLEWIDGKKLPVILSQAEGKFPTEQNNDFLDDMRPWINAQLGDRTAGVFQGVSSLVRAMMYGWAFQDHQASKLLSRCSPWWMYSQHSNGRISLWG